MESIRRNPDHLLKAIQQEEDAKKKGRLKIFFGYAAGVGKTYAMLQAAQAARQRGTEVVAGYVEPHARPETSALLDGLEQLPFLHVRRKDGIELREFDLDAALARKPQLLLVDELAHTNAEECRHAKRYQDVQELLKAGIDVYTTVNVQHIESLNDTVASVTGVLVRERIPDSVFDSADQVELVDIEPQDLIDRLKSGKVYRREQASRAIGSFFTVENLTALREIALRRCADRVNLLSENARIKNQGEYHTEEHILVCLSSAPSNKTIIRTAARMAKAFRSSFTALFVETPDYAAMTEDNKKRLRENTKLAEQLGAKIETVFGDDVPYQIAEFARLSGISKIVIGRSTAARRHLFSKPTLTDKLIAYAPDLDIHIIPDNSSASVYRQRRMNAKKAVFSVNDVAKSLGVLLLSTCLGLVFWYLRFSEANVITIYILGVLITSVIISNRIYSLASSAASVIVFNLLFTEPRFTLLAHGKGYPVTFIVMFLAAFISGTLANRLKRSAEQSAQMAYRMKILFDTNQLFSGARDRDEVVGAAARQLKKLLNRDVVFYHMPENGFSGDGAELPEPLIFTVHQDSGAERYRTAHERAVAAWVMKNNKHAGAGTGTLSNAMCRYLAVRSGDEVFGVLGIYAQESPLDAFENSLLLSILGECALALENEKNAREKEAAAVLAKNEQLRANLLRSISHDLRTPLTSISGNASNLMSNSVDFDEETRQRLYSDIYDDSMWLINLVENLLAVTRIEDGQMNLRLSAELLDEVIEEALKHVNRKSSSHEIRVESCGEFLLARMDARLIVQVIINIVDNAVKYTPEGSKIVIASGRKGKNIFVSVADDGPGISDEAKPYVFDMFYTGANRIADSRRSLGLGLSLCKSIVTAHGGEITVKDNRPTGTIFTFTLPAEEVTLHE